MFVLGTFESLRASWLSRRTLYEHNGARGFAFGHYPTKPGLAATADGRIGKEGYLITRQRGLEPNTPFPGASEASWPEAGSGIRSCFKSSQTPSPMHSYKTRCSGPSIHRQVPAPLLSHGLGIPSATREPTQQARPAVAPYSFWGSGLKRRTQRLPSRKDTGSSPACSTT